MFEFAESVFNELMGVVAFEIVKDDWECASREVEFGVALVTECASIRPSDVTVVATFLVFVVIEKCFAA